jgi:hypothetical protein
MSSVGLRSSTLSTSKPGPNTKVSAPVPPVNRSLPPKPLAQPLGQHEIGHVVERECEFEPVLGKPAPGEECARVIDQDVDALLPVSDLSRHAFHLGEACEISKIYRVGDTRRAVAKSREGRVAAGLVPCDSLGRSGRRGHMTLMPRRRNGEHVGSRLRRCLAARHSPAPALILRA